MKKMVFSIIILFTFLSLIKSQINGYEYWFDRDVGNKISYTLSSPSDNLIVNQNIPTNSLVKGLHQFNFRSWDVSNKFSGIVTEFFYKTNTTISLKKITDYEYWFDKNFTGKVSKAISPETTFNLNQIIDASSLNNGMHQFNIRFKDDTGNWSGITTDFFYKISQEDIINKNITAYQYCFDRDFDKAVTENISPAQSIDVNKIINVSTLKDGLHIISFRFLDDKGNYSSITTDFFYKKSRNSIVSKAILAYQVWADKDFGHAITVDLSPAEQIFEVKDLLSLTSPLPNGLHLINFRFKDTEGNWSSITTDFFVKKASDFSPKNIVQYEYWFNEDYANKVQKEVTPTSSYRLNTIILPGTLTTRYNILNFRFKDDSGEWSSVLSETFQEITLATVENTLKEAVFYPNPFEEKLFINLGKNYHNISVEVFDFSGRIVYQNKFNNKDLLELQLKLNSGVYQLILKADDKVTSRKILRR